METHSATSANLTRVVPSLRVTDIREVSASSARSALALVRSVLIRVNPWLLLPLLATDH